MNLNELFKLQAKLDEKIVKEKGLEGQDLLNKKILALQVELGELAQNWRGFKYWSNDQKPRTTAKCEMCDGLGNDIYFTGSYDNGTLQECSEPCEYCDGTGNDDSKNQLLEEYVDCLHFILSIGLELGMDEIAGELDLKKFDLSTSNTILSCFIGLSYDIADLYYQKENDDMASFLYEHILLEFAKLGKALGFTWQQVEQAYLEKNKINHERQEQGY